MLVAQLLALAAATCGVAARDARVLTAFSLGNETLPGREGTHRLDTLDTLAKRTNYYSPEAVRAFGDWATATFDRPWDGNLFIGASYMHHQIDCDASTQTASYQGAEYVRYHFHCGARFWTEWVSLTASAGNYKATNGGGVQFW